MARPKGLHPPTVTAVRITEETKKKLDSEHKKWNSKEPYDRTLFRALSELEETRKKVKAQNLEILSLQDDVSNHNIAIDNLKSILLKRDETISNLSKKPIEVLNK